MTLKSKLISRCIMFIVTYFCSCYYLYSQKSTFENINDAVSTVVNIFGKKKDTTNNNTYARDGVFAKKISDGAINNNICKELCIRNYNKKNCKIELKNKKTYETTTIAVMSKDKSCLFDISTGTFIIQIIIDDKIVKSSDIRILNEMELIEVPDI